MRGLRRRYRLALLAAGLIALAVLAWPAGAAGPWKAQVLDAETGQPLEGVVVLARWDKRSVGWPHPERQFHDIDEIVSDADGRFVIPARDLSTRNPWRALVGPIITMFKPGYGHWTFRPDGPRPLVEEPAVRDRRLEEGWRRLVDGGALIELARLRTTRERSFYLESVLPGPEVPAQKIPHMRAAGDEERARLDRESKRSRR
jgi:hypothetical protein